VNCPECDEKYLDYLYGELSSEEKRAVEEHLGTCEYCAKQLSPLQLIRTSFKRLEQEPSALVHQRILAHARDSALEEKRSWLAQFLFKPATAMAAVVTVALGIYVYTQYPPLTGTGSIGPMTARQESYRTPPSAETANVQVADARAPIQGVSPSSPSEVLTRVARAVPDGRNVLQLPPAQSGDAHYAFELGNLYFNQGEFANAIATYSLALTMNPQESQKSIIGYQLALSYKNLNDCKTAVQVLDDIQRKNPQYPRIDEVYKMAGDCYLDLEDYNKAEKSYANLIRQFPDKQPLVADSLEKARNLQRVNVAY
jgi:tetratricopeptide (TPR) repeat protein